MKFLYFALFIASNSAFAQIWDYILTSKSSTAYYIDPASIVRDGDVITYTQLLNYPKGYDSQNPEIHSIKHAKQIDCRNNISRTLTMIAYAKENAMGNIQTLYVGKPTKWEGINERSILNIYKEEVCK